MKKLIEYEDEVRIARGSRSVLTASAMGKVVMLSMYGLDTSSARSLRSTYT